MIKKVGWLLVYCVVLAGALLLVLRWWWFFPRVLH
jgi:hypothetical protein